MTRLAPVAMAVLLGACGPVDVVVARLPDGGFEMRGGPPCQRSSDCGPEAFCERPDCGAPVGRCQRRPLLCEATLAPVCGCNGVSYLNDCLRRASGETAATVGECPVGVACTTASTCPDPAASCAHLYWSTAACPPQVFGSCWVVPPAGCPEAAGAWSACAGTSCTDFCVAVRSGASYHRVQGTCP